MFDVIIVGSGAAGVSAAYQLRGRNVLMLDVGLQCPPNRSFPPKNIYDIRRDGDDVFELALGERFESLHNIAFDYVSPKLKGPLMRYITDAPEEAPKIRSSSFDACLSYCRGGLAAAWGAGAMRFRSSDLKGFPVTPDELEPYYDALTQHMGIAGEDDDLTPYFGSAKDLLPPLRLSANSRSFLESYKKHRARLQRCAISAGYLRAAVLSREHNNRAPYQSLMQDFFQPNIPAIYSPAFTLSSLLERNELTYLPNKFVLSFTETSGSVEVTAKDISSGSIEKFAAKVLCLAAGTINTARIVLSSYHDYETRLPILDNAVSFLPLINPLRIGMQPDVRAFAGGELVVIYDGPLYGEPIQSTVYGLMAPLRSDLIFELPLSIKGNLTAMKYLVPAITVLQTFYPDDPSSSNFLQLNSDNSLSIQYQPKVLGKLERHLAKAFLPMGYLGTARLAQYKKAGSSIHYAGCLPMNAEPQNKYETGRHGLLFGTERIFVADAATFPRLPSKNLTFTIMANAMRISSKILEKLAQGI